VTEVIWPQLRMAVQAEPGDDRAAERAHEVVGEQVGASLTGQNFAHPVGAPEHVVAVQPGKPSQAELLAQLVKRTVAAAVGVPKRDLHPLSLEAERERLGLRGDPVRPVVQPGR
jgi:hypothetical protein